MNSFVLATLCVAFASGHQGPELTLTFRVTPGKTLEKDYEHTFTLGTRPSQPFLREERRTVLQDRYVKVGPAGVSELVRRFERVVLEGRGVSPLQGENVRFTYDPASEIQSASYVEPESARVRGADADQLAALNLDADATGFLPDHPVALGDEWLVPAAAVLAVLGPGGTYVYRLDHSEGLFDSSIRNVGCTTEGLPQCGAEPLRARLTEVVSPGADRIAIVALEGEVSFVVDFMGPIHLVPRKRIHDFWIGFPLLVPRRTLMGYDFEGTLRWNVDSHHLDELHLVAEVTLKEDRTSLKSTFEFLNNASASDPYSQPGFDWNEWYDIDLDVWDENGARPAGRVSVVLRVFC